MRQVNSQSHRSAEGHARPLGRGAIAQGGVRQSPRRCARSGAGRPEGVFGPCATVPRSIRRAHFRMDFGNVSCAAGAPPIK